MNRNSNSEHLDLRVRRTYKLLRDALTVLLRQKSFDRITVREICDQAMVRRTTFYQHFEDKQDFLVWFIREMQKDFISRSSVERDPDRTIEDCLGDVVAGVVRYLKENRLLIESLSRSSSRDISPLKEFSAACVTVLTDILAEYSEHTGIVSSVAPSLAAEYYIGGIMAAAGRWFADGCPGGEEDLSASVRILARGGMTGNAREKEAPT